FVVVCDEVVERAVVIAAGNARVVHQPLSDRFAPAVAACYPSAAVRTIDRFPPCSVADWADVSVRRLEHATILTRRFDKASLKILALFLFACVLRRGRVGGRMIGADQIG